MPKQTKLDEKAIIYQPRKLQTEKEKLKEMSFRDKFTYLWEYYRLHALGIVIAIALIIYIIYQIITPDVKTQFYAAIIDSPIPPETIEDYGQKFSDSLQLDPKTADIQINDTFYLSSSEGAASNMQSVLVTYVASAEIDVIIAPESSFSMYATSDYFTKLSDALPTDVYSSLTDYFYITDTSEVKEKNAYGIYLTNSDLFKDITYNGEPYVLGVVANYKHEDNTVKFIRYLFKESEK